MPEGDVVRRAAIRTFAALRGSPLTVCDVRWPSLATADLTGRTLSDVGSHGKHLLLRFGPRDATSPADEAAPEWTLHVHFRMEGYLQFVRAADFSPPAARSNTRIVLGTRGWVVVGRSIGMLDLVRSGDERSLVGHLGPDLLADGFDAVAAADRVLGAEHSTIGAALLDQRLVAGIGTIYMAEALFAMRLSPLRNPHDVPRDALVDALTFARTAMSANSLRPRSTMTGSTRAGEDTYVHGRAGRSCLRCGTTIVEERVGIPPRDRPASRCPDCQKK